MNETEQTSCCDSLRSFEGAVSSFAKNKQRQLLLKMKEIWSLINNNFFRSGTVEQLKNGLPAIRPNAAPTHKSQRIKQHNHYYRGYVSEFARVKKHSKFGNYLHGLFN